MADISPSLAESPAELVAIAIAAHKAGDTELQTAALRKLRDQDGMKLSFSRPQLLTRR